MSAAIALPAPRGGDFSPLVGRTFLHPAFDYLVIGGGLSLMAVALLVWGGPALAPVLAVPTPVFLLTTNLAHFASSTVRLYTKTGTRQAYPFLTMGLPLATLLVVSLAIAFAQPLGPHLQNLYLTWSPYHYAAQAYGLGVMYCYRSGAVVGDLDKRLMRAACLAPFLFAFFKGPSAGIEWFAPASLLAAPAVAAVRGALVPALAVVSLLAPVVLYVRSLGRKQPLPLITLMVMASNAIWWVVLLYQRAFVLATIFHGLQYLAIVTIFHVRERLKDPDNRRGWAYHALAFYAMCVALAWALFSVWPYAYVLLGFGLVESVLLTVATINVHHFIVDAYIWRLRGDPNYQVVASASAAASAG
jgi:hypothetical protein